MYIWMRKKNKIKLGIWNKLCLAATVLCVKTKSSAVVKTQLFPSIFNEACPIFCSGFCRNGCLKKKKQVKTRSQDQLNSL